MDITIKNKLDKQTLSALNQLTESEKEIVLLTLEPPFQSLSHPKQDSTCYEIISRAHYFTGVNNDVTKELLKFQSNELKLELNRKENSRITASEIEKAFQNGLRGEYGAFFGLNGKTYHQFIKAFLNEEKRALARNRFFAIKELPEPTNPNQIRNKNITACLNAFEDYKNTGKLPFMPHKFYLMICELKAVKTLIESDFIREKIYFEEVELFEKDLENAKKKSESERKLLKINDVLTQLESGAKRQDIIINRTRTKYLKYYFDKLIKDVKFPEFKSLNSLD